MSRRDADGRGELPEELLLAFVLRAHLRGYEVWIGRPETLRQQLQDGREMGHHKDLLAANQQVDYGRCSRITLGVTLRFCE